ncbi:C2H2 type zinc-finger-domain-containing protein [Colletotrichum navitas]|uniref:C2H2 type zinc-finger-domain-containing protein n=1 Tax=Colletotrichum navitas TaxID=681940 RepID=A0AAD8PXH2_9PEZI|nr:C2H2 type zinc-finger-domain-containing protein [Colletotrichum navitas]KAK1585588.1 C2H2 type zinc-finger-domain-containing protein [Colletotrichum navitas]
MEQSNSSHFKLSATSCGACAVHFDNSETRRAHSKSQWHVANLRRRVAGLGPLTAEQHAALSGTTAAPTDGPKPESDAADDDSSSSLSDADLSDDGPYDEDEDEDEDDDNDAAAAFAPEVCLFCNAHAGSFDDNLVHMGKTHGMFVPSREKLIVDLETLVRYLHLVVFGYQECLQCGTQRRTAAAVQQHMLDKGHCKFDITAQDSEFRDFYEDATGAGDGGGAAAREGGDDEAKKAIADAVEGAGGAVRLPSGKTLAHRSAPAPSRHRTKLGPSGGGSRPDKLLPEGGPRADEADASFRLTAPSAPGTQRHAGAELALTRAERRGAVFETQLARLGANDRAALAHLPPAEQRSVLLTQKRQLDRADKAARRLQTRLEMKANKTAQGHFVNDVPGRSNG